MAVIFLKSENTPVVKIFTSWIPAIAKSLYTTDIDEHMRKKSSQIWHVFLKGINRPLEQKTLQSSIYESMIEDE